MDRASLRAPELGILRSCPAFEGHSRHFPCYTPTGIVVPPNAVFHFPRKSAPQAEMKPVSVAFRRRILVASAKSGTILSP